jgi:hypothetical protein
MKLKNLKAHNKKLKLSTSSEAEDQTEEAIEHLNENEEVEELVEQKVTQSLIKDLPLTIKWNFFRLGSGLKCSHRLSANFYQSLLTSIAAIWMSH